MNKMIKNTVLFTLLLVMACTKKVYQKQGVYQYNGVYEVVEKGVEMKFWDRDEYLQIDSTSSISFEHDVKRVKKMKDELNRAGVMIHLTEEGKEKFKMMTTRNVNKKIAIVVYDQLVSAPIVMEPIVAGKVQVTGISEELIDQILAGHKNK